MSKRNQYFCSLDWYSFFWFLDPSGKIGIRLPFVILIPVVRALLFFGSTKNARVKVERELLLFRYKFKHGFQEVRVIFSLDQSETLGRSGSRSFVIFYPRDAHSSKRYMHFCSFGSKWYGWVQDVRVLLFVDSKWHALVPVICGFLFPESKW